MPQPKPIPIGTLNVGEQSRIPASEDRSQKELERKLTWYLPKQFEIIWKGNHCYVKRTS